MKFILLFLVSFNLFAFTLDQKENLEYAYNFGKHYGMENTLRAIVMVESSAGKNLMSANGQDCGIAQINITSWKARYDEAIGDREISDEAICSALIKDRDLSLLAAVEEIKFWRIVHGTEEWRKIWGSYNAGYNYNSLSGRKYGEKVAKWIRYFNNNPIVVE